MEVFGSSGTRGVANEELTPAFVLRVAKAAGTAWQVDRVAIARDTRYTGRMLADAAASGLTSTGTDVDRLGIISTPGAQGYAEREGIPVIVVTASHNPPQYNGIKLVGSDGVELAVTDLEAIEETLLAGEFAVAPWDETGRVREIDGVRDAYIDELLAASDRETIADADLTVALDPGHGAGTLTSPEFFRELGCRVLTVNSQPDGKFPGRDPEPVPDNLGDLGRLVRTTDADIGIAHDGDADRAIFFDEHGEFVSGDAALAALAAAELESGETTVSAVNVSQRLVDVVTNVGADLELTPIGSTNIITRIEELEATGEHVPIAGEGNGGIFFPDYRLSRDGAYTAARFLELVAEQPVSEIVGPYDGYANIRRNIKYESTAERDAMLDAAANHAHAADAELNTRDGYRLDHGDAWVLARPSGTEPLVRVYAEARDADRATQLVDEMYETLAEAKVDS
ncbi:phosphoglucosamine mutase [Natrialba hulunbeirensis JCM 10989]|uniref:Phosphoglucosamine mutase n=1 Tax=Natrialba hulunbeirensis JCM 10989 TaxID=1227493 RepID=L9ZY79_9EURY|nr:phosphoglucosamine mutase [Natrialba hulunbeirensis]ELY91031.1 phosphoglucosamine mutase [Natrialba hulunbeirensis JCM 10989]